MLEEEKKNEETPAEEPKAEETPAEEPVSYTHLTLPTNREV